LSFVEILTLHERRDWGQMVMFDKYCYLAHLTELTGITTMLNT